MPSLEDWQHWTLVMGRAQQMLMQAWADGFDSSQGSSASKGQPFAGFGAMPGMASPSAFGFTPSGPAGAGPAADPMALMTAGAQAWAQGLEAWGKMLGVDPAPRRDPRRRFAAPSGRRASVRHHTPDLLALADKMLGSAEEIDGVARRTRHTMNSGAQLRRCEEPVDLPDQSRGFSGPSKATATNLSRAWPTAQGPRAGQRTRADGFRGRPHRATTPAR